MKEENNHKLKAELWETPIFNGWAKKVEHKRNFKNYDESDFIKLASNELAHHSFMGARRRHNTPGSEIKDYY
mgnify:CR=1 FL=1